MLGRYQILPFDSVVQDIPFIKLWDTKEVCVPRMGKNADGTPNPYKTWIKLLPVEGYKMKDDKLEVVKCTGPNGNVILFPPMGGITFTKKVRSGRVLFWVNSTAIKNCAVHLWKYDGEGHQSADSQDSDLKLPIRLVRTK